MEMKIFVVLITIFLFASTEASKRKGYCKCRFSLTENKVNFENRCKFGYKPSHDLIELQSTEFGVTSFQCKCRCKKIKKEFAQLSYLTRIAGNPADDNPADDNPADYDSPIIIRYG